MAKDLDPAAVFKSSSKSATIDDQNGETQPLTASESKKLFGVLLTPLIRCLQIQTTLYRLILIKTQRNITRALDHKNEDSDASPSVSGDGGAIRSDLQLPLEAVVRCGDIQKALFQSLLAVCLSMTRNIPASFDRCAEDSTPPRPVQGEEI